LRHPHRGVPCDAPLHQAPPMQAPPNWALHQKIPPAENRRAGSRQNTPKQRIYGTYSLNVAVCQLVP
jgi:hypothetical protein